MSEDGPSLARRLRRVELALPVGVAMMLLGGISAGAQWNAWLGLNDPAPPLRGLPAGGARQLTRPPVRQVRRVVLVIADGLIADVARGLPTIARLGRRGVRATALAAGPTYSAPSYTTWLTGLDPTDSGVRTNRAPAPIALASLLSAARSAGLKTLVHEDRPRMPVSRLFAPAIGVLLDHRVSWPRVLEAVERVDLAVLCLDGADYAGHHHGPDHPAYRQAAAAIDRQIGQLERMLDPARDLLVVVNDHGHLPGEGGHGGIEPQVRELFVAAFGAGLGRGVRRAIAQRDLAPTLALLLGVSPPAHNRGASMSWALDPHSDPGFIRAAFASQFRTRLRVERFLARELGAPASERPETRDAQELVRARQGDVAQAERLGRHIIDDLARRVAQAQQARLDRLRLQRGALTALVALGVAVLLVLLGRARVLRVDRVGVLLPVAFALAVYGGLRALGIKPSMSFNAELTTWLIRVALPAAVGAVVYLLLAARGGRSGGDALVGRVVTGAAVLGVFAAGLGAAAPIASGAALPDLRLLASLFMVRTWFVFYCGWTGVGLVLVGLGRRSVARARAGRVGV